MTKSWLMLVAVALVVWAARSQAAEPEPTDAARADADAAFSAGQAAFAREDYAACVDDFRRAYAILQHDAVRFNIAVCLERLARYREAIDQYERAAMSTQLDEEARQRATVAANGLRPRLGHIEVSGAPAGSPVSIDGVEACRAPCTTPVDPGRREVVVPVGKRSERRVVTVESGGLVRIALPAPAPPPRPRPPPPPEPAVSPGALTWVGAGLTAVGIAGIVGFGVRALSVSDEFDSTPTEELAGEGELMRNLANASIGVAALGAVLIAIDLIWVGRRQHGSAPATSWRF